MMVMSHIVNNLMENFDPIEPKKISQYDYQQWCRGFVFDALRDHSYGQSFCHHFGIRDNILRYASTVADADAYIRKNYVL
jgi:hypothetical protein